MWRIKNKCHVKYKTKEKKNLQTKLQYLICTRLAHEDIRGIITLSPVRTKNTVIISLM